jgi:hypothetical protein
MDSDDELIVERASPDSRRRGTTPRRDRAGDSCPDFGTTISAPMRRDRQLLKILCDYRLVTGGSAVLDVVSHD